MLGNPIFSRYENLDRWFCFIETINVSGVKSSSNVSELYQGSRLLVLNRIMKAEFFFFIIVMTLEEFYNIFQNIKFKYIE